MQKDNNSIEFKDDEVEWEKQELLRLLLEESETSEQTNEFKSDLIHPQNYAELLPLSFTQERLWFMEQLEPDSPIYNFHVALRMKGPVNEPAIEFSLNKLIEKHYVFRSSVEIKGGLPYININDFHAFDLDCISILNLNNDQQLTKINQLSLEQTSTAFNLSGDQLLRYKFIKFADNSYVLMLTIHHMAIDGWSMGILFAELSMAYEHYCSNKTSTESSTGIQYVDFANWQREQIQGQKLQDLLDYWKQQLAEPLPVLELATDRPRPLIQDSAGGKVSFDVDRALSAKVQLVAQKYETTCFVVLLATFRLLLKRYSNSHDICIGTPFGDRSRIEIEDLIGPFINNVVLRLDTSSCITVSSLIEQERDNFQQAFLHRELPFEKLVEELNPVRDRSRSPLFQVMFIYLNTPPVTVKFKGIGIEQLTQHSGTAEYDISLTLFPSNKLEQTDSGLSGFFEYSKALFDESTIDRMVVHFDNLLKAICTQTDDPVSHFQMLSKIELDRIFKQTQGRTTEYVPYRSIHHWIADQAKKQPDKIAMEYQGGSISYGQLNTESDQLALFLIDNELVETESIIGLCISRSRKMIVSMLAILKAGGAYLPLDPTYPEARLVYMLEDSDSTVVITEQKYKHFFEQVDLSIVNLDTQWNDIANIKPEQRELPECNLGQLAYIIYTSGSTGKPKGVLVEHGNVINFLQSMSQYPGLTAEDRLLAVTTISFDIHVLELFLPLVSCATIILADFDTISDAHKLYSKILSSNISVMQATPSTWQMLIHTEKWNSQLPLTIFSGGEPLTVDLAKQLMGLCTNVWNLYGPTETTVWSSVEAVAQNTSQVTIGSPIENTSMFIVNADFQLQPTGVTGELLIGGKGVSRGYLGKQKLTNQQFIQNPFSKFTAEKLYKTGDLARLQVDGKIEVLGRLDDQVKLRGHRIELGEIETALLAEEMVKEAVVMVREDNPGDQRLVGYVIGNGSVDFNKLRQSVATQLPDYMVPSVITELQHFPKTSNNKLDRNSFPRPIVESTDVTDKEQETVAERILIDIFNDVLSIDSSGVYDNFFDLGGHSLLSMKVIAKLEKMTGVKMQPGELFQQTIGQVAATHEKEITKRFKNKEGTKKFSSLFKSVLNRYK